ASAATVSITVTPVNDPPAVDLNGGAGTGTGYTNTFTEDGGPVAAADPALAAISDVDNTNLASLTVTLTNHPDGAAESLAVTGCNGAITGSYSSGTLALSGSTTVGNYQACLRTLAYNNSSQNPDAADRSITVVANDGAANSNTATATIHVVQVNDPPAVDLNGGAGTGTGYTNTFTEDGGPVAAADPALAAISDVDNTNLASLTVTLTNHPDGLAESLAVPGCNSFPTRRSSDLTLALSGSTTVGNYQACL